MSVRSRGRCVLHPALLTSRKLRSPQDLNRPRPLALPTPTDPPRRSMSASTIRPVRHSIPLPLSIIARPHQAGLIRSWRADSLAFVWLDPGITPCCKSLFGLANENSRRTSPRQPAFFFHVGAGLVFPEPAARYREGEASSLRAAFSGSAYWRSVAYFIALCPRKRLGSL